MILVIEISGILAAYLLGAVPFGYILTKHFTGMNILESGSGNVGSTNVRRVAGKKVSLLTQILDMLKGMIPVGIFMLAGDSHSESFHPYYIYMLALAAIIGHDFSIFLRFRGGKGVNTTLGASVLIAPWAVVIAGLVYFLVKKLFKYVSPGSIALSLAMPVAEYIINGLSPTVYYLIICSALIIILHRKNIQRLLSGKENL
ncbi:MAG: glycerol-3-phosphate 1-O-acyltransferase PlsY [Bacteroidales bacterium]|nr:glycerol-3-phosphate 1-O-acyltransferase PlsY [Bacteroidales bacterium]